MCTVAMEPGDIFFYLKDGPKCQPSRSHLVIFHIFHGAATPQVCMLE